jgi:hypothetical protein
VKNWNDEGEVADYLVKILKGEAYDHSGLIYGQGTRSTRSQIRGHPPQGQGGESPGEGVMEEFGLYRSIEKLVPEVFKKVKGRTRPSARTSTSTRASSTGLLGIPGELYTPIFAVSRIAGWCAHASRKSSPAAGSSDPPTSACRRGFHTSDERALRSGRVGVGGSTRLQVRAGAASLYPRSARGIKKDRRFPGRSASFVSRRKLA